MTSRLRDFLTSFLRAFFFRRIFLWRASTTSVCGAVDFVIEIECFLASAASCAAGQGVATSTRPAVCGYSSACVSGRCCVSSACRSVREPCLVGPVERGDVFPSGVPVAVVRPVGSGATVRDREYLHVFRCLSAALRPVDRSCFVSLILLATSWPRP